MAILLAFFGAVSYGAGDFCGSLAARRAPAIRVTLLSQLVGGLMLIGLVPLVGGSPNTRDLVVGALAGVVGAGAITAFYQAMAAGAMSVVAPISALTAAALPVFVGLLGGERPSVLSLVGVAIAMAAILLVSQHGPAAADDTELDRPAPGATRRSMVLTGIGSGVLFGLLFITLDSVSDDAGLWPLVTDRLVAVPFLLVVALVLRTDVRPERGSLGLIVACGVLDMGANTLLLLAFSEGLLVLVAVIISLYPASTLVLARVVLHERVSAVQRIGLIIAGLAVVLIAVS